MGAISRVAALLAGASSPIRVSRAAVAVIATGGGTKGNSTSGGGIAQVAIRRRVGRRA